MAPFDSLMEEALVRNCEGRLLSKLETDKFERLPFNEPSPQLISDEFPRPIVFKLLTDCERFFALRFSIRFFNLSSFNCALVAGGFAGALLVVFCVEADLLPYLMWELHIL